MIQKQQKSSDINRPCKQIFMYGAPGHIGSKYKYNHLANNEPLDVR